MACGGSINLTRYKSLYLYVEPRLNGSRVILNTSNSHVGASSHHQNHNNMKGNVFLVTSLVYVCSVFCCSCCCYYKISGGMNLSRAESVSCEDLCIIKILYSNND